MRPNTRVRAKEQPAFLSTYLSSFCQQFQHYYVLCDTLQLDHTSVVNAMYLYAMAAEILMLFVMH